MTNQSIMEMVCAFAAGCMDRDNFVNFKNYLESGKELPREELGELQNIVAMIPIILELEEPDPSLKKKVAERLLEHNNEVKAKKKEVEKLKTEEDLIRREIDRSFKTPVPDVPVERKSKTSSTSSRDDYPTMRFRPGELTDTTRQPKPKPAEPPKKESKSASMLTYIALFLAGLTIAGLVVVGLMLNNANKDLQTEVDGLKTQLSMLQRDFKNNEDFINKHMSLIEFFHYNDITVINLENADSSTATGKLFLSFEERESLLQTNSLPALSPDEVYELWYVTKNVSISMGVFIPKQDQKYVSVTEFPTVPKEEIDLFRITIEPAEGSGTPTGKTVLFGAEKKPEPKPVARRRRW